MQPRRLRSSRRSKLLLSLLDLLTQKQRIKQLILRITLIAQRLNDVKALIQLLNLTHLFLLILLGVLGLLDEAAEFRHMMLRLTGTVDSIQQIAKLLDVHSVLLFLLLLALELFKFLLLACERAISLKLLIKLL